MFRVQFLPGLIGLTGFTGLTGRRPEKKINQKNYVLVS